jgi:transketolase
VPFLVLRAYEQIRNNVCLHKLPVKLVGNGGGYGFGIMGASHHGLEDLAAMRALPHLKIYVPLTAADVAPVVALMAHDAAPNYLRLNRPAQLPGAVPPFAPWRKLKDGRSCVVVGVGPVLQGLYDAGAEALLDELEVWSVGTFPLDDIPPALLGSIAEKGRLVTMEEHCGPGGLGEALAHQCLVQGVSPSSFTSLTAAGYPSGRYGSQRWHQEESGLAGPLLWARLQKIVRG